MKQKNNINNNQKKPEVTKKKFSPRRVETTRRTFGRPRG